MKRGWFLVLGVGLLTVFGVLTALFGTGFWSRPIRAVQAVLLLAAGVAFINGGRGETRYDLTPLRLIGVGNVALGGLGVTNAVSTILGGVPDATGNLVAAVGAGASGIALMFIGIGLYRGGDAVDIDLSDEPIVTR